MSQRTPGFIIDMFFDEIDSTTQVMVQLRQLLALLNSNHKVPDLIVGNMMYNELLFPFRRQYKALTLEMF